MPGFFIVSKKLMFINISS